MGESNRGIKPMVKKKCKIEPAKVSVVKCSSYDQKKVDKAIEKALKLIDYRFKKGMKVLIKPNILGAYSKSRQKYITTNPSLVEAVCKILKKNNCKIYIGESSFMNTDVAFKASGIERVAKKYAFNKKPFIFEQEKLTKIRNSTGKILKQFPIAKIVKGVDLIINMPKMKTHSLAQVTLGIKNLYGLIPGGLKQRFHTRAKGDNFSEILIDIYQNIQPQLNIIDGIWGMDGHGPASGSPQKAGYILASENTVALDIACSSLMDFNPKKIPVICMAVKRGLYPNYKFELVGMSKLPVVHFRKPTKGKTASRLRKLFGREMPIICDIKKCIKCGNCAKRCPVKAITMKPYPIVNKKKCIRCFCCMEICPVHALSLGKPGDDMWQNVKKCEK